MLTKSTQKKLISLRKIQIIFLSAFSGFMLSCAQNVPFSPQTLDQNIEHLLDEDADCSIPDNAQIIHLPQIHKHPDPLRSDLPKAVLDFLQDVAARSQFLIAHIISQNSSRVVFNEGSQFVITEKAKGNIIYSLGDENGNKQNLGFQEIADIFNHRLPSSFNSLNREQKNLLTKLGAAPVAFSLDHITTIHRTHTPSEAKTLEQVIPKVWDKQRELREETHDLYERILTAEEDNDRRELRNLYKEAMKLSERRIALEEQSDQLIIDDREEILAREVHFFLENNPSQKVFIIYGTAHDLSDEFSTDAFHTLPHVCTMPESFIKSPFYAGYLENWADRIRLNNDILLPSHIQSIRVLYRKSYAVLTDVIEQHIQEGGRKEDHSISWNSTSNKYFTYSELESIAESIYVKMTALENLIQEVNAKLQAGYFVFSQKNSI